MRIIGRFKSQSRENVTHFVRVDRKTGTLRCTCEAFKFSPPNQTGGKRCRHTTEVTQRLFDVGVRKVYGF